MDTLLLSRPLPRSDTLPTYLDVPPSAPRNKTAWNRVNSVQPASPLDMALRHGGTINDLPQFTSPASRPINDFDSDAGSDVFGNSLQGQQQPVSPSSSHASVMHHMSAFSPHTQNGLQAAAQQHLAHAATAPGPLLRTGPILSSSQQPAGPLAVATPSGPLSVSGYDMHSRPSMERTSSAKFRTDLMLARTGTNAMDRYKALTRLLSMVKRELVQCGIEQPFKPSSWTVAYHDLLCKIVEIGEALSSFGTADFGERTNSSRAINTKDYAYLLKMYGETYWGLYRQEFIDAMPHHMQDEMWTVRGLLTVRFEANAIIHDQLMKHIGLEQTGGGGAVVYNTSVVSANPVNNLSSKPKNAVHAYATAASKAIQSSHNKLGLIALASAAGLYMIKRTGLLGFVPGMGRPRGRRHEDDTEEPASGRRSRRSGGSNRLSADERLLLAFDHVDKSYKELNKAQKNIELLKNDWRLGTLRLSAPFGGPDPPGFEAVDLGGCEPRQFMHAQLSYQ